MRGSDKKNHEKNDDVIKIKKDLTFMKENCLSDNVLVCLEKIDQG